MKQCLKCLEYKPLDKFRTKYKNKVGYKEHICIACWSRSQHYANKAKVNEQRRRRRRDNPAKAILYDSRRSDKLSNRHNDLTYEFIVERLDSPCSYCGETSGRLTLDRIDNAMGHTQDNVVTSCIRCNYLRRDMPYEAWVNIIAAIRDTREKGLFGVWTGRCR